MAGDSEGFCGFCILGSLGIGLPAVCRPGPFAVGFFADLLEARNVAAPLTKALLGADVVVLLAIVLYFRLHFAIRSRNARSL